jgi:hypothetical protein
MKKTFSGILCLLILLGISISSSASEFFIDKDAPCSSDTCDGTTWATAWKNFSDINWTTLNGGENTIYISGGSAGKTYTSSLNIEHTGSGTLEIRPGSASPSPVGYSGLVTISPSAGNFAISLGAKNVPLNVTISGEKTIGSGVRNIKLTSGNWGILGATDTSSTSNRNLKVLYLEMDGSAAPSSCKIHAIYVGQYITGTEIAHNYIHDVHGIGIHQAYNPGITGFGQAGQIHHNIIKHTYNDSFAADWYGGWDFYNNELWGIGDYSKTPGCHADGMQSANLYMRVFNNEIHDMTQGIFMESLNGGTGNLYYYIYNNIFYTRKDDPWTSPAIAIEWRQNGGIGYLRIVNNTFYNMGGSGGGGAIIKGDPHNIHFTNTIIANNLFLSNKANIEVAEISTYTNQELKIYRNAFDLFHSFWHGTLYKNISSFNNVTGAHDGNANIVCTPSLSNLANYDFHIQPTDTCLMNKGIDLSTYGWTDMGPGWGKDKDGNVRGAGAWDIGAYEFTDRVTSKMQ